MRISLLIPLTVLGLSACDSAGYGEGEITGSVGDATFGKDLSIYHGSRHIVVVDRKMDCLDMSWVTRNYFSDDIRSDKRFAAVQFTFDGDAPEAGTFSLDGNSAVTGWRVISLEGDDSIDGERAREGILTIDSANEEEVIGSFEVLFGDGNAQGSFISAFCRNVR
jgi:hypothetical protein